MARRPSPSAALRSSYPILLQLSLVASLALCIALFSATIQPGSESFETLTVEHEVVMMEEIERTRQWELPPPPPSMPAPVEVPDDQVDEMPDLDLDMELDLTRSVAAPPPPAPPRNAPPPSAPAMQEEPEIFIAVEQMPELIGGLEGIRQRTRYPEMARRAGIEGTAFVQLVVNGDGSVQDLVCIRDPGGGMCEAAIEAIRQSRFNPGLQRGRAVRVRMSIPVRFRLYD